ncbi:7-cyano-7-deazaguanine synthase QueC [bacterium]|nr:7-cyano-7-deazaguanine synthase QueC [bacterium]
MSKKAVVLLSGGLDSTTCAYLAKSQGYEVYALSFDYGQRLVRELDSARAVAKAVGAAEHIVMKFDLTRWGGSALTQADLDVPTGRDVAEMEETIPVTYVPGRNILFLSFAASYAEAKGAEAIFIGVNALDYSGYPDCRPEFIQAYQEAVRLGTKAGVEGQPIRIETPLLHWTKAEIIQHGLAVGTDYGLTWSCYQGGEAPCGTCDSCLLRAKGFAEAGVTDAALALS